MGWSLNNYRMLNIGWFPAQADAVCSGRITSGSKTYEISNAPCYQDKNWGTSFPKWWTWVVSNKFENNENAIFNCRRRTTKDFGHPILLRSFYWIKT